MVAVDDNVVILILFIAILVSLPVLYTFFTSYVDKSAKEAKEEAKERERDFTQRMMIFFEKTLSFLMLKLRNYLSI